MTAPMGAAGIVLVGGRGIRLGGRTEHLPKPLLPVSGRPFLYWVLGSLATTGVRRFVLAAGHHGERIEAYAANQSDFDLTVVREPAPLGTAGAIAFAAATIANADPLLVANGDSIVASDVGCIWEALKPSVDAVVVATIAPGEARYGRLHIQGDLLTGIKERGGTAGPINAGIYAIRRRLLQSLPPRRPLSLEI